MPLPACTAKLTMIHARTFETSCSPTVLVLTHRYHIWSFSSFIILLTWWTKTMLVIKKRFAPSMLSAYWNMSLTYSVLALGTLKNIVRLLIADTTYLLLVNARTRIDHLIMIKGTIWLCIWSFLLFFLTLLSILWLLIHFRSKTTHS